MSPEDEAKLKNIEEEMAYHKKNIEDYTAYLNVKYSELMAAKMNIAAYTARLQELDFYKQKIISEQPKPTPAPPAPGVHLSDEQIHEAVRKARPQQARPQTAKQKEQAQNEEDLPPVPLPYDRRFAGGRQ